MNYYQSNQNNKKMVPSSIEEAGNSDSEEDKD